MMRTGRIVLTALAAMAVASAGLAAEEKVDPKQCFECHTTVEKLNKGGKHEAVNCVACHSGLAAHLKDQKPETRPATNMSWYACGECHKNQLESFLQTSYHRPARDEKSQLTGRSPNPYWDKLMSGHGFTREHNTTRSHAWMVVDQFLVDRAFGGRFDAKDGWKYVAEAPGKKTFDYIVDSHPESNEHKVWEPGTAPAANPTCIQCKSQDKILEWPYMGDPAETKAKWNRASNVVELARTVDYSLNCHTCHDPHAAKPRVVRDALIQALTRTEPDNLYLKDDKKTKIEVIDMGERGFKRKIAILEKYDSRLQCGQCHVEYNCNPGTDPKTGNPVKFDDARTNIFPFRDVFGLYDFYVNQISFLDFKNGVTGGLLWKAQHPEAETFYNSKHAKAGVSCDDCHTPKIKGKDGKEFTSHFAVSPRFQLKETCLTCHKEWDEEKAKYVIDSEKSYVRGKMRKAEYWISELMDKIVAGKKANLAPEVIKAAQDQHLKAHILWEYWTAENSDGFHNPDLARDSLMKSMAESQAGIKIINDALNPPAPAAAPAAPAAPAAAPAK